MPTNQTRFIIAPDSFKGSIDAKNAAIAIQRGILRAGSNAKTYLLPMADGGEGTAECITQYNHGHWFNVSVTGPDGDQTMAGFGWLAETRQAVIDVASCGGLAEVGRGNLWQRHSQGVGELLRAVLNLNPDEILIGLGGSASNDAGMGLLAALGMRFFDINNQQLNPTPAGLGRLHHIDCRAFDPRLKQVAISILSDVTNPLCGPNGATAIFGPQKGAGKEDIAALDQRLKAIAQIITRQIQQQSPTGLSLPNQNLADAPGSGAAGGIGFALQLLPQANLVSGAYKIAELIGITRHLDISDVLITGEGYFDQQSLSGKAVGTLLELSKTRPIQRIIIAGQAITPHPPLANTQIYSLSDFAGSTQQSLANPAALLEQLAYQIGQRHLSN